MFVESIKASRAEPQITQLSNGLWLGTFEAMASPCEVHIESEQLDDAASRNLITQAAHEAWRIEEKFSRYRSDNIIHQINHAQGKVTEVDAETAQLLNYADKCYELTSGMFDITSGLLRRVWTFNKAQQASVDVQKLQYVLNIVGWDKCQWRAPELTIPKGAEIDLGGIGKEYAVDKTLALLLNNTQEHAAILVNFGGDLACAGVRIGGQPWRVGVEAIDKNSPLSEQAQAIELYKGALATSGDAYRYVIFDGKKRSHVLNPKTGYPMENAPQSVTVAAPTCTLAGMLATFAMLEGTDAEEFLSVQNVKHWIQRN